MDRSGDRAPEGSPGSVLRGQFDGDIEKYSII